MDINRNVLKTLLLMMAIVIVPLTTQAQELPPCLDEIESMEFESPEELIEYVAANCDSTVLGYFSYEFEGDFSSVDGADGEDFEGSDFDLPPCLEGIEDMDFEDEDALFDYLNANCDSTIVDSLFGFWGNWDEEWDEEWDDYEWSEEDEIAWWAEEYKECIGEQSFANLDDLLEFIFTECEETPDYYFGFPPCAEGIEEMEFADDDAFWEYLYSNCDSTVIDSLFGGWGDWDNGDWGDWDDNDWGEWSEEDEIDFLTEQYTDCLGEQTFDDLETLYEFVFENCEDDYGWGNWDEDSYDCGNYDWSEEDEMAILSEEFGDCIGEQTFTDLDAMYTYIFENCNDDDYSDGFVGNVEFELSEECILALDQDFATFQAMLLAFEASCEGFIEIELPDCFLSAPLFDNDEDFFEYLNENCSDVFEEDGPDGLTFSDDDMDALIASYNLGKADDEFEEEATTDQTALGIEAIDGVNMSMFPNPATDFIQLSITEDIIQDFQLFDVKGSLQRDAQHLNNTNLTIDVSDLNIGTYFIRVSTENGKTYSNAFLVR